MPTYSGPFYYHQLGYLDHQRCFELLRNDIGHGAILSPESFPEKWTHLFPKTAQDYKSTGKDLWIDPQGYDPNIVRPEGSPLEGSALLQDENLSLEYNHKLLHLQASHNASSLLIPGYETNDLGANWQADTIRFAAVAVDYINEREIDKPLFSSIVVDQLLIRSPDRRLELLELLTGLKNLVDGIYLIVLNVPTFTTEVQLLIGLLDVIFRLKWQGFSVMVGYSGPWAMLGFPFGLDRFANSGLKNRQKFTPRRQEQPKGWGPPGGKQYHDYYSPKLMGFLRYPDDFRGLPQSDKTRLLSNPSSYSPPPDQDPDIVKEAKIWTRGDSYKDFSTKMHLEARQFQGLDREDRIILVRTKLDLAQQEIEALGETSGLSLSDHVFAWKEAFDTYLSEVQSDLEFEFG